jgi:hypothetical protein
MFLWGLFTPFLVVLSTFAEGNSAGDKEQHNARNTQRSWADLARLRNSDGRQQAHRTTSPQFEGSNHCLRSNIHKEDVFQIDNEVSSAREAKRDVTCHYLTIAVYLNRSKYPF